MSLSAGRPSKNVKDQLALSDVTDSPKKTVRVNFNLDEDKHIALKRYALESRKTVTELLTCLLYTSPSPRDRTRSRMPSSA